MSTSMDYQLQMMESISNIIQQLDERESGKSSKQIVNENLKGALSDLKSLTNKAQKVWEKERKKSVRRESVNSIDEAKKDNPPVDYGGYELEDPKAKYAARHLKPTDSYKEKKKREVQAHIEKLLKRAPDTWLEKTEWRAFITPDDNSFFIDRRTDKIYSFPSGRPMTRSMSELGYSEKELQQMVKDGKAREVEGKIVIEQSNGAAWLSLLIGFIAILLKVLMIVSVS